MSENNSVFLLMGLVETYLLILMGGMHTACNFTHTLAVCSTAMGFWSANAGITVLSNVIPAKKEKIYIMCILAWSAITKYSRAAGLNHRHFFLPALEARWSELRPPVCDQVLVRTLLLAGRGCLLTVCPRGKEKNSKLSGLFL